MTNESATRCSMSSDCFIRFHPGKKLKKPPWFTVAWELAEQWEPERSEYRIGTAPQLVRLCHWRWGANGSIKCQSFLRLMSATLPATTFTGWLSSSFHSFVAAYLASSILYLCRDVMNSMYSSNAARHSNVFDALDSKPVTDSNASVFEVDAHRNMVLSIATSLESVSKIVTNDFFVCSVD